MLDRDVILNAAERLDRAERTREPIRHFSVEMPSITIADAYAIQAAWVEKKVADGRRIKGRKIGLTSRAMQVASEIDEPDYGVLFDDMFYNDGDKVPVSRFIVPRFEVELAFVLGRDLTGPDCSIFDVLQATEFVSPAVEIIDTRFHLHDPEFKTPRRIMDTISDNAANAALILGGRPVRPMDVDLRRIGAVCYQNGVIEESGVAAAILNHPANGVAWLANKLAIHGESLKAGQVILGGSFTRPVYARVNDSFHVDFGELGTISCQFV